MRRAIVNVATGHYVSGQRRLCAAVRNEPCDLFAWANQLPPGSPGHGEYPYAFKAFALKHAADQGYTTLLWADASILPVQSLAPVWERIERDGYWVSDNGWNNGEWTADQAYPFLPVTREENWKIPHVVATCFGLDLRSEIGGTFLAEYLRMATNGAFRGPWYNRNHTDYRELRDSRCSPCGDATVRGHRHDQTVASILAHQLGMTLTKPPNILAYRGHETADTIFVVDGSF